MPAPPLANSLEGGSDTTTITAANSGGASGDAFSTVVIGASATLTFSATQARGALSMAVAEPVTGVATYVDWTALGSITSSFYLRFYLFLVALPSATTYLVGVRTSADVAVAFPIRINVTTGVIEAGDGVPSAIAATLGAVACATGKWIRIEGRVIPSTTAGEIEWRLFNTADSTIADDTKTATGLVLGGANIDKVRFGQPGNGMVSSQTIYFDDIAVSTAGWIGPSAVSPAAVPRRMPLGV